MTPLLSSDKAPIIPFARWDAGQPQTRAVPSHTRQAAGGPPPRPAFSWRLDEGMEPVPFLFVVGFVPPFHTRYGPKRAPLFRHAHCVAGTTSPHPQGHTQTGPLFSAPGSMPHDPQLGTMGAVAMCKQSGDYTRYIGVHELIRRRRMALPPPCTDAALACLIQILCGMRLGPDGKTGALSRRQTSCQRPTWGGDPCSSGSPRSHWQ